MVNNRTGFKSRLFFLIFTAICPTQIIFAESTESAAEDQSEGQGFDDAADDKQRSRKPKSKLTSRDIRREQITHLSFFYMPLGIVQMGGDLDVLVSDQWSVGVTGSYWENLSSEDKESNYTHYGFHLKRYFGNSFYVKPSLGWHKYESSWMTDSFDPNDGYKLTEGIGLHVELGHDWSINRYLGVGVTYFAIGPVFDPDDFGSSMMSRGPSLRLIGSF